MNNMRAAQIRYDNQEAPGPDEDDKLRADCASRLSPRQDVQLEAVLNLGDLDSATLIAEMNKVPHLRDMLQTAAENHVKAMLDSCKSHRPMAVVVAEYERAWA